MKANLLKKRKSSRKKKTKELPNCEKEPLPTNGDGISTDTNATKTSNDTRDCAMDTCPEVTQIKPEEGELEALGVLTVSSEQHQQQKQQKVNLQPHPPAFRAFVPKTEPDCVPLNPPSFQVKTEPGIFEVLQRESTLIVKEENDSWKEVKLETLDENSVGDSGLEKNTGNTFI